MKNQCGSATQSYCLHLKICGALWHTFSTVTAVAFKQCSGSMTFWSGSGSGSADPCLWLMDPDPAFFVIETFLHYYLRTSAQEVNVSIIHGLFSSNSQKLRFCLQVAEKNLDDPPHLPFRTCPVLPCIYLILGSFLSWPFYNLGILKLLFWYPRITILVN
jgi:hypothetical protein